MVSACEDTDMHLAEALFGGLAVEEEKRVELMKLLGLLRCANFNPRRR